MLFKPYLNWQRDARVCGLGVFDKMRSACLVDVDEASTQLI